MAKKQRAYTSDFRQLILPHNFGHEVKRADWDVGLGDGDLTSDEQRELMARRP